MVPVANRSVSLTRQGLARPLIAQAVSSRSEWKPGVMLDHVDAWAQVNAYTTRLELTCPGRSCALVTIIWQRSRNRSVELEKI